MNALLPRLRRSLGFVAIATVLSACSAPDTVPNENRIRFPEGSGGINQPEHRDKPYVVMLSLDGFRHDYLDLFETPNLDRIVEAGVRAEGLVPVFAQRRL